MQVEWAHAIVDIRPTKKREREAAYLLRPIKKEIVELLDDKKTTGRGWENDRRDESRKFKGQGPSFKGVCVAGSHGSIIVLSIKLGCRLRPRCYLPADTTATAARVFALQRGQYLLDPGHPPPNPKPPILLR